MRGNRRKEAVCLVWLLSCLLFATGPARAEQLPIKTYTIADGLVQDSINRIVRDSRGYLWFCTEEGLSRFDGYQFTNYTTDQGLPHRRVNDLLETRNGHYWVATSAGICRLRPTGAPLFVVYSPGEDENSRKVGVLAEDGEGAIWCGTHSGLYRLVDGVDGARFEFVQLGMSIEAGGDWVQAIIVDREGSLWLGTVWSGLYRRWPDGRVEHYTIKNGLPTDRVQALLGDRAGRVWVGTPDGLGLLVPAPDPNRPVIAKLFTTKDGLPTNWIEALFQSADATLWIGTDAGLIEFLPASGKNTRQFRLYTTGNGLSSHYVQALAEDGGSNVWIGTDSGGAMKLARSGFTSYTEADGLAAPGVDAVFENKAGELCVISAGTRHFINRYDGERFASVLPALPSQITNFGWGYNQVTFQDHAGEWWVPTGQGLCRFPAVSRVEQLGHTRPKAIYTTAEGLPFNDVFRLYEDSHGDIWISTISSLPRTLSRWDRASQTLHTFSETEGFVSTKMGAADAFCEDGAHNLWIGRWSGGLTRYAAGRFTSFTEADGLPAGTIRALYLDSARRLWIAASLGGLARVDNPSADRPEFITYTTAESLSSNDVWCITEDQQGRIYVGTGRGLDRLDPQTGDIEHYTAADGLARGKVTSAFRDRNGVLWFASNVQGLSRFVPGPDPPQAPPPILINGLRIAGVVHPLSQLGEIEIPRFDLGPNQNQLSIDFVGLSFEPGEVLRYQYQLEGADKDWSPLSNQRSVNYANLAPGRYRFMVRAVNDEGLASAAPATLAFAILPPVWRRVWFLVLAALLVGLAFYALHRQRVGRLVELERVRTRIATDLHDDIGANLSLIAMLSEVARGQLPRDDLKMKEWFSTIAATSRDTVDAMSDIVWAVNPRRDHLRDLTQRMRRFAEDIFGARGIEFEFRAPEPERDLKVGADLRREVFLVFKETVNNSVRHSACTEASAELQIERGWLVLEMTDNGRGLAVANNEGIGLASMRSRATKLGGSLEVNSLDGRGTRVILRAPLYRRAAP